MTPLLLSIIIYVSIPLADASLDDIRGLSEGKPTKMTVLNPKLVEGTDGHTHLHFTGTNYDGTEKHFDEVIQYYIDTPEATSQAFYHKDHIYPAYKSAPEKDKKYFIEVNCTKYLVTGKHMNEWKAKYHQLQGWDFFEWPEMRHELNDSNPFHGMLDMNVTMKVTKEEHKKVQNSDGKLDTKVVGEGNKVHNADN